MKDNLKPCPFCGKTPDYLKSVLEGRESYNASLIESEYYLFDAGHSMPMLTA